MKPIVKWVGGKRKLAPFLSKTIIDICKDSSSDNWYFEPFLGGAAVALNVASLKKDKKKIFLSDICKDLINTYATTINNPKKVIAFLEMFFTIGTDEFTYYKFRNKEKPEGEVQRAARFLYLNKLCFNGLYRENKQGKFNVPYGGEKFIFNKETFQKIKENIYSFSKTFKRCLFGAGDFEEAVGMAKEGDVLYADPPYLNTFSSYNSKPFSIQDQERLAKALFKASYRGVKVLVTNSDSQKIKEIYKDWLNIFSVSEYFSVSGDSKGRGKNKTLFCCSSNVLPYLK